MQTILSALIPVFLLIALGYGLRLRQLVPDSLWPSIEKMTYFLFFPALLFLNCLRVPLDDASTGNLLLAMGGGVLAIAAMSLLGLTVVKARPAFSSVFQGAIRPNTYVGLAAAAALYGKTGVALTSVCVAIVVPLVNLLSVMAMLAYGEGGRPKGALALLKPVIANPLINACLLGLLLNLLGIGLPQFATRFLDILASASLPMGLLAVGAGVDLKALSKAGGPVFLSAALKMLTLPLVTLGLLAGLGLGPEATRVGFLYALLPCSASSYVLARQMGGDAPLMANIISVQTVLAMASMPLLLILFGLTP
jgi:predicted permease